MMECISVFLFLLFLVNFSETPTLFATKYFFSLSLSLSVGSRWLCLIFSSNPLKRVEVSVHNFYKTEKKSIVKWLNRQTIHFIHSIQISFSGFRFIDYVLGIIWQRQNHLKFWEHMLESMVFTKLASSTTHHCGSIRYLFNWQM